MTADETPLPDAGDGSSAEAAFDPEAPEKKKRGKKSGGAGADGEETS